MDLVPNTVDNRAVDVSSSEAEESDNDEHENVFLGDFLRTKTTTTCTPGGTIRTSRVYWISLGRGLWSLPTIQTAVETPATAIRRDNFDGHGQVWSAFCGSASRFRT